jgi:hypothetical protein
MKLLQLIKICKSYKVLEKRPQELWDWLRDWLRSQTSTEQQHQ